MAEAELEKLAEGLLEERPTIDTAARNFLAVVLACQGTGAQWTEDIDASRSEEAAAEAVSNLELLQMEPITLQRIVGALLRNLNQHQLLAPAAWAAEFPQREKQSGLDRIEEVKRYKVAHMVCSRLKDRNLKVAKSLGKSVLQVYWTQIRDKVYSECSERLRVSEKVLDVIFSELLGPSKKFNDLIWAVDFSSSLSQRSLQRKSKIDERLQKEASEGRMVAEDASCTIEEIA